MLWVESHIDLGNHPKTFALQTALNADLPTAIGVLHLLWHFTLRFCWRTGDLSKYNATQIAYAVGWKGDPNVLLVSLQESGWLDGMIVHDWLDYAGKIVRDRLYNEQRRNTASNDVIARKSAATRPDLTRPDITKQQHVSPIPPKGGQSKVLEWFEITWKNYPTERRIGKKACLRVYQRFVKNLSQAKEIASALENYLSSQTVKAGYIKNATTFFNNWEDYKHDDSRGSTSFSVQESNRPPTRSPKSAGGFTTAASVLGSAGNNATSQDPPAPQSDQPAGS